MTVIRLRRGTTAQWAAANPVLALGEAGVNTDDLTFKIGDGVTQWSGLRNLAVEETGFRVDVGSTPPANSTVDGYPVIWIPDGSILTPVPTTPTAPAFNYSTFTVTPPTVTGVQYQFWNPNTSTWVPMTSGVETSFAGFTRPFVCKVRAQALPGYVLTATYEWSAQWLDAGMFSLYASDTFTGTPGALLENRVWDMGGGGSGSAPTWQKVHATANKMAIASTGTAATMNPAGWADSWGGIFIFTGADGWKVEIDLLRHVPAHSRAWQVYCGGSGTYGGGGGSMGLTNDAGTTWKAVIEGGSTFVPAFTRVTPTYLGSSTEGQVLGTWTFTWVNRYLTMKAPDGTTWGQDFNDYTPSGWAWGQALRLGVSDYNTNDTELSWPWFDAIRLYR